MVEGFGEFLSIFTFLKSFLNFQENDEFYECITSKFISDSMHPVSVHLAAARLLLSTSPTWMVGSTFVLSILN